MVVAVSGVPVLVADPGGRRKGSGLDEWSQLRFNGAGHPRRCCVMVAIGCFLPFLLAIAGAVLGHLLGSGTIGLWGMGIGFAAGLAMAAVIGVVAMRAKSE
ncbi:hypothetical protein E9232_006114 [Inquilinus ginsengisoli]|uniref:AtpZ/AtpI family protein n=1 Tax=Inquilinus ginsengisoli TaxID=363840 RepID=A0ABU1JY75_9PROT|nr:hypothetical protein [Inquilinus ginsengisoli]MDR6293563.1 hypothetical protein [Inquilinus ginsengisoli]